MPEYAEMVTRGFSLGIVMLHVLLGTSGVHKILKGEWFPRPMLQHLHIYGLRYAAAFPVFAFVMSLWYSEIVGLPVCALCWFGRTMMYPLAIMLPLAAWRGDRAIWRYAIPLSAVGALVTLYQHFLQVGVVTGSLCSVLKDAGDCAARYVFEFGYVTMPLFGVTVFVTIALLLWIARR